MTRAYMRCRVSDELAQFLGGKTSISRPELTSAFWDYIKSNNLQVHYTDMQDSALRDALHICRVPTLQAILPCCRIPKTGGMC